MKKSIVFAIIILIVIFGLIAYFVTSNKQKPSQTGIGTSQPTSAPVTTKNSLIDLLRQGNNVNCTYTSSTDKTVASGTVYVSGKKIRVDYSSTFEGKKNSGSMIRDENFTYIWGDGMPRGIKMKNTSTELPTGSPQTNQYFDQSAKMDYKCSPWSPSSASFTPPSNITFSEFSLPAAQPTSASGSGTSNSAACAACNNLTGQTKTLCLTQLHCQ